MTYDEAMKNCIFRFMSGSNAYGTNNAQSDEDFRGVFIAPLSEAFDLFHTSFVTSGDLGERLDAARRGIAQGDYDAASEQLRQAMEADQGDLKFAVGTVSKPGNDEELQELRKFLKLAADCNPNIIEFLYVERGITHTTPIWERIKSKRDLFLNKKARYTFSGYAIAQLKRIQTHRGYLLNPPKGKPTREEFGLPNESTIDKTRHGAVLCLPDSLVAPEARAIVSAEKKYHEALDAWRSYDNWRKTRNVKRQDLESRFGYDCKHAMHLVRLIRMAKEILIEKTVNVYRPDRFELHDIRNGAWPYEKVVEMTQNVDAELEELYAKSDLRNKPDHKGISELYVSIAEEFYGIKVR